MGKVFYYLKHPQFICIALLERFGGWIPDKIYLQVVYRLHTGKNLHLSNPVTFNEKIQWLKLNDKKQQYTYLVDKSQVKDYVANIIGKKYIIPTLCTWDKPEEIDYDKLPQKFVLKTTHDGGGGGVVICDKANLDIDYINKRLNRSLRHNIYKTLREWPYKNVIPRIIAEPFVQDSDGDSEGLKDYKFFCFNGEPKFCQVKTHENGRNFIDIFDMQWNLLPFTGLNPLQKNSKLTPPQPINYELMVEFAKILCDVAAFVRVDFYNSNGDIFFGEITFYPASGMGVFTPDIYDLKLGELLKLNCHNEK